MKQKKNMRKSALLIILIIITASVFIGCDMLNSVFDSSLIITRIEAFETALNASPRLPSAISANFADSPTTAYADQMNTSTFWDTKFNEDNEFSFTDIDPLDTDNVTATMTESYDGEVVNSEEVSFKMYKDDSGWLIEEYYEAGTNVIKQINPAE